MGVFGMPDNPEVLNACDSSADGCYKETSENTGGSIMPNMRGSGSYLQLIDESFTSFSQIAASCIVPMRTKKGQAVETVTLDNYKDVVGYDLDFNNSYLGLTVLLQTLSQVTVFRLMHDDTYYGNAWFLVDGTPSADTLITDPYSLAISHPTASVLVWMNSAGDWADVAVSIDQVVTEAAATASLTGDGVADSIVMDDVGFGYSSLPQISFVGGGGVGATAVATLTNGSITGITVTNAGSGYTTPPTVVITGGLAATVGSRQVTTYFANALAQYIPIATGIYVQFDTTASDFVEIVNLGEITIQVLSTPSFLDLGMTSPEVLSGQSDGTAPTSLDLDFSPLQSDTTNLFVCANGQINVGIWSAIVQWVEQTNRFALGDVSNLDTAAAAVAYKSNYYATEFSTYMWGCDNYTVDGKGYVVFPSVYLMIDYAKMINSTGYPCYPPAGRRFGSVAMNNPVATDYASNAQYLKVNKLNYIKQTGSGRMIWEQRTNYASESDLSYDNAVLSYIVTSSTCKTFIDNLTFTLIDQGVIDLLNTGLNKILSDLRDLGFIWSYKVIVPTLASIQLAGNGRFLNINIPVQFAQDLEETTLVFHIESTTVS
jgi:hypothetical protein